MVKKKKQWKGEDMIKNRGGFISDFLDAIWGFLDVVKEMEMKGKKESFETGEKEGPAGSKIAYQYNVRFLSNGKTSTGNKLYAPKLTKPLQKKPLIDVFDRGKHISVVVSLPQVKKEDLEFKIVGDSLKITIKTPEGKVNKNIPIPKGSGIKKIEKVSFKNGILEIKLKKEV